MHSIRVSQNGESCYVEVNFIFEIKKLPEKMTVFIKIFSLFKMLYFQELCKGFSVPTVRINPIIMCSYQKVQSRESSHAQNF